MGDYT